MRLRLGYDSRRVIVARRVMAVLLVPWTITSLLLTILVSNAFRWGLVAVVGIWLPLLLAIPDQRRRMLGPPPKRTNRRT